MSNDDLDILQGNKDVSVIICSKNPGPSIKDVLKSVKVENPLEIILVDALSEDGTREIAEKYVDKIITDPGKGLALARSIGLKEAKGNYIFFAGSDNIIETGTILRLKRYLIEKHYVGVAALTRVINKDKNYFTKGLNKRWEVRFVEGKREVIGTPYLFKSETLLKYDYDPKMSWSDDSDLAVKIARDGLSVGYSNVVCYEIGIDNVKSILSRFRMYGLSDYEYYKKYSSQWNCSRKIKSLLHPIMVEFYYPLKNIKSLTERAFYTPFFFITTLWRYYGWIKYAIKEKE